MRKVYYKSLFGVVVNPETDDHRPAVVGGSSLLLYLPVNNFPPRVLVLKLLEDEQYFHDVLARFPFEVEGNERVTVDGYDRGKVNNTLPSA